jgi:ubiquinone/menaquinone biosynthesis C-methylase UbiE
MSNLITKTTELAMALTLTYVRSGDTVVDATCGTGQDTAALAKAVGPDGRVYAFDIQKKALLLTEARLKSHGYNNVKLMMKSFESMSSHIPEGSAAAVVFNLGYLPGGDHSVTTTAEATIRGLEAALRTVKTGGIVTVVMYDGHEAGREEKKSVMDWAESLDSKQYHAVYVNMLNQKNCPPEIILITKKK